ncbi:DUF3905 domain-containing protein [Alkalihalobacillus sp. AL-G]|uniref:DUF3905 domain-containing protein n=1 Tax=Alkalihalobacillus sp. AL-G TaxID=2926399 RepID=UPI00272A8AF3|nr:DUF3905 domain-containing protein [Alkalihalobacillus sp. AL-G]WLD93635.1 DUF3905 domain-containing protein [Alkalihalobacillus sp. AL-G]
MDTKFENQSIQGTLPHQANAPVFDNVSEEDRKPFVNEYGVTIGDSHYESENSPLNQWSDDTDPSVMSGDEWVHPYNDIGWNSSENRELAEEDRAPKGSPFMHPTKDVSYARD